MSQAKQQIQSTNLFKGQKAYKAVKLSMFQNKFFNPTFNS